MVSDAVNTKGRRYKMSDELAILYRRHQDTLEDFWNRRGNRPHLEREFRLFGRVVRMASNHAGALASADFSIPQFSVAPPTGDAPFSIQLIVQAAPIPPGPAPDDLMRRIQYAGEGDWLAMQLGAWGYCQVELSRGRALAVLAPELAEQPELICRCLLNTILTNFFIAGGLGLLHATCLVRADQAILLIAPHNAGKSTTALHLALAGYKLMSDSMVYVAHDKGGAQLLGFPVGRVKLREDMTARFPRLQARLVPEPIRGETKRTLDLRQVDPALVQETVCTPAAIDLCLLRRGDEQETRRRPAARAEVMEAVMMNSLYYDTEAVWRRNLMPLERLVDQARLHHLVIGSDANSLTAAIASLPARE